jgi:hypothetical protein
LKNSIRAAIQTCKKVGQEVRDAIMRIGGTFRSAAKTPALFFFALRRKTQSKKAAGAVFWPSVLS